MENVKQLNKNSQNYNAINIPPAIFWLSDKLSEK